MRILLTTDTIGGVWTFTKELTIGLLKAGHSVALASFGHAPSLDQAAWCASISAEYEADFCYYASPAPLEWMPENKVAYSAAGPLLLQIAEEFSPDLLHANQFCFGRLPLSVPKIITAHSDVLSWAAACRPAGLEPSEWLTQYCALVQHGLDGADAVIAPTQWMLNALNRNFRVSGTKHVILNGRNIAAADHDGHRTLQAVCAGRLWDEAKNTAILSNICTPFPILLAGEQHQKGVATPVFSENITLLGKLDENDMLALFRASSIYLATSIYEPFGLAPLEAALCGCAVVANDIPSFREVWDDAAIYFKSAENLDAILTNLRDSPVTLDRSRQKSRRRALQLTRSRMTESYLALYTERRSRRQHSPKSESVMYA